MMALLLEAHVVDWHLAENGYVVVGDVVSRAAVQSAAEVLCTRALCDAFISPDLYSP